MIRSGFFNSLNHDRLYYNSDISRLFNSLIIDGVFQNIGDKFIARPGTGMQVIIPSGFAYFNSTWLYNDADYIQAIDTAPLVSGISRIDGIFLKMCDENSQSNRDNLIYYMAGTESSSPVRPTPEVVSNEEYIPICYITISSSTVTISSSMITNMVGTSSCPFVSGILETIDASDLMVQWQNQFVDVMTSVRSDYNEFKDDYVGDFEIWINGIETNTENWRDTFEGDLISWFENLQTQIDTDTAIHLQNQINAFEERIEANESVAQMILNRIIFVPLEIEDSLSEYIVLLIDDNDEKAIVADWTY